LIECVFFVPSLNRTQLLIWFSDIAQNLRPDLRIQFAVGGTPLAKRRLLGPV
jgi:hypothetical protein